MCENQLPGAPPSEWDIEGAGDASIQGFTTDISVDQGQTVSFKIDTDAAAYQLEIYRLGYYAGLGARKVATVLPSVSLPQSQPACLTDSTTGLVDCGNWAVSARWTVPATAVSGIYVAKLTRQDTGGASHIVFVVRDDDGESDLLFQTSDTTWQAYNQYGGNSLYVGEPAGRAYKVSYNRPFTTRENAPEDWVFNAEYPMVRWLEENGYHVSYTTGVDTDRRGGELLEHRLFLSVGHDEYWSAAQRTAVEAARAAGIHLAFFSGNEVFWKIRWEPSIAPDGAPARTLVSYKETHADAKIDPAAEWTGTWADPRFSPPSDGGRPQNALTGQFFTVNCCTSAIEVPAADGQLRFWRHTSIATLPAGQVATLPDGTLGYEWDEDLVNGARPPGLLRLSHTVVNVPERLQDYGSTYAPGLARHALTLYRHTSGALVFGAGTVQWSWGLDGNHDRGSSEPSRDMRQATVNLFADMGVEPLTPQLDLTVTAASTDTDAPISTVTAPAPGSTVPQHATITISGTATDVGGGLVAAVEVSVDGGATWQRATGRTAWTYSWQTGAARAVTILSRAADDSGNLSAPSAPVAVTVGTAALVCPCSIWNGVEVPANPAEPDTKAVELGLKFRAAIDGYITGVRFYKSAQNTGTHTANLWTSTGQHLATAAFTDESASGWQQVDFDTAVEVVADTTYVVSYHTPTGFYAQDTGYFDEGSLTNGPLTALGSGVDGANGTFKYGGSGFPSSASDGSNYWVDVVFVTTAGPDLTPPSILARVPTPGASAAAPDTSVKVTFNERIDPATLTAATFELRTSDSTVVSSSQSWDDITRTATLQPLARLAFLTTYTATVKGGTGGIKDRAGNALPADISWSFTTAGPPPPPPTEGPGGPILIVSASSNPFTGYYAEILRAEGFNSFDVKDLADVTPALLAAYDVVVLGEMPLSAAQVAMFSTWVTSSGNLIAMRPDKQLASLLGLVDAGGSLSEGYLLIDTSSAPGAGLVAETIQYHGTADRYTVAGATAAAMLYSTASSPTGNPAVTIRNVGASGGTAVAFTYDLARSVVYTRQGNPAWAGQERDGFSPIRSNDLFFGGAEPDYVDRAKIAIPQADEQQRLLANIINYVNVDRKPLPRFWYLPRGLKAAVVMTGDDHGNNGTTGQFNRYEAVSAHDCSVDDWACIRSSSYIYPNTPITAAEAAAFDAAGFEIGVHVSTRCEDYTPSSLSSSYAADIAQFAANFPGLPAPVTNRTHCIAWSDYVSQAQIALASGMRLDTNYYYWPESWVNGVPGLFTGSGMPMRFAGADGTMIDVYQAATQMTDESGQGYPYTVDALLDRALGPEGYYGAFVANMHTDTGPHADADAIVASAMARGVPVISARQLLTWLDGRNASSFGDLAWNGSRLDFTVTAGAGANGLHAMLPFATSGGQLVGIIRGGAAVPFTLQHLKGVTYAAFAAASGTYSASYAFDLTPPVISDVTASVDGSTATIAWTTSEAATSVVRYGLTPAALSQTGTTGGLDTMHRVTLTGLTSGRVYYYRVTSEDAAGNSASAPSTPAQFRTAGLQLTDTTVADFSAGTIEANVGIEHTGDGALALLSSVGSHFNADTLPAGWNVIPWTPGGSEAVSNGTLTVDGALVSTDNLFSPGRSLEFRATFGDTPFQHVGFAVTLDAAPWAIFSTLEGGMLQARTSGATQIATHLGTGWLGTPHVFRIDWLADSIVFSIDGAVVATHLLGLTEQMRPVVSDLATGDGPVEIDWIRLSPYVSPGIFVSRVLDGGTSQPWDQVSWVAQTPAGTAVNMEFRFGNTPTPDSTWTPFLAIPAAGTAISNESRYVQYRATLVGTDADTPLLESVTISAGPIIPLVSVLDTSVLEEAAGITAASVTVTLSRPSPVEVSIAYATGDGSATPGIDYTPTSGTVVFAPGTVTQTFEVAILGDSSYEPDEHIIVNLTSPVNSLLERAQSTIAIVNDDAVPIVSAADIVVVEGDSSAQADFTVVLSNPSDQVITVAYATAAVSASAGTDFIPASGVLTFAPGTTLLTVSVPVVGDTLIEPDETFVLNLSGATNATIGRPQGVATIAGDDFGSDTDEPNDTAATAATLTLGAPAISYLFSETDVDWYRVVINRDAHVRISLDVPSASNFGIDLYEATTAIASSDNPVPGADEEIWTTLPAGTYHVRVSGAGTFSKIMPYALSASASWFNDSFEPNNARTTAVTIGTLPYESLIYTAADHDWYRFTVTAPGAVNVQLTVPTDADLQLALYSSAGAAIATSDNGQGANETINQTLSGPGDYFIKVDSLSNWSTHARYRLTVSGATVANPGIPNVLLGLGPFGTDGGWFAIHTGGEKSFDANGWGRLPWPTYNATGGGVRLAAGDVDGDGADEIVVGLGPGSNGWLAVLDDAAHGYGVLSWLQVTWPAYNTANGETFPAVGDLDGDGRAEIVVGLGDGGRGWYQIFDDTSQQFRPIAWQQVTWPAYTAGPGPTHPAVGDIDGDGIAEIVVGLGRGSAGWLQVISNGLSGFTHRAWIQIDWLPYTSANGTTFPALGDIDQDGRAELVVGLGKGSNGWFQILDDQTAGFASVRWDQVGWPAYAAANGETHPAVGNIDGDPAAEIVLGLSEYPGHGGWFEIRDYVGGTVFSGWRNVGWTPFTAAGGGLFPAIATRR